MKRREFLNKAFLSIGAAASSMYFTKCQHAERRPNIIFLLTDDQRWDTMGCMGNEIIQTPNMDKMANQGVLFKNTFVTTAICGASRASILTGQYERRHGVIGFGNLSDEANKNAYPLQLKKAGYRIGFIGKYGVGNPPVDQFDYWKATTDQPNYENKDEDGNYKHYTRICCENALEFLQKCTKKQPFCLSVSFKAPHVQDGDPRQFIYDPVYKNLYKGVEIPLPKTADDKYFYDVFPEFFTSNNEARRRWNIRFSTYKKYQESVRGYYRLITGVDDVIGKIRKELELIDQADDTIIILMGDNGFYLGEHGMAGKWYGHEESIRVPLIVYDPRLPKSLRGLKRDEMALNIDIAPTLLDMAGVSIPNAMQGQSLKSIIKGKSPEWRDEFFYEHRFQYQAIPKSEGVVTKRYKYLRYIDSKPMFEELYDLKTDKYEEHNLARNPRYSDILVEMRKECDILLQAAK
jgi:arylsulfatase A-like enzyme